MSPIKKKTKNTVPDLKTQMESNRLADLLTLAAQTRPEDTDPEQQSRFAQRCSLHHIHSSTLY